VLCSWAIALGAENPLVPKVLRLVAGHPLAFEADKVRARTVLRETSEGETLTLERAVERFLY
jgi:hypothetical protein